ncbi:MAG: cupredoxin domain-containing protein [Vicinamibacterales bacterium]
MVLNTKGLAGIVVVVLLAASIGASGARQAPVPPVQRVDVLAERFSFTPSEIKTTVGTVLEIRLTSDDTSHGFRIVGTDVDIEIPKRNRGTATVMFQPPAAGRYTFECSQLCGAGHAFMRGVIVVREATASR